jgi:ubiquinone biosynthesis protein
LKDGSGRSIEEVLAAHGLARTKVRAGDAGTGRRLRQAVQELGPVFGAFGFYLGTRPDLWRTEQCLELCAAADSGTALVGVRSHLEAELGMPLDEAFTAFDDEPLEIRRFFQVHRARLHDGSAALVWVRHPEAGHWVGRDIEALGPLGEIAGGPDWVPHAFGEALGDFRRSLDLRLDFRHQVEVGEALAQDARDFDLLRVPPLVRQLCGPGVLVRQEPPGWRLDTFIGPLSGDPGDGADADMLAQAQIGGADLARYLCLAWLRQALAGRAFPVEPLPHDIALLPGAKIAFLGGPFAALPAASKDNLRAYLVASAAQEPDRACACLLEETVAPEGKSDLYALRLGFRQVVPFRDGGWSLRGDSDTLAEHLFVHWRLMAEHGFRPKRHVLPFFRGLFLLAAAARQIAPRGDALREGLDDLRLLDGVNRFADMMSPDRLDDNLDRLSSVAIEFPKRLDAALSTLSDGDLQVQLEGDDGNEGRKNTAVAAMVVTALLVAGALWFPRLRAAIGEDWLEPAGAVAFAGLGLLLLYLIRRLG